MNHIDETFGANLGKLISLTNRLKKGGEWLGRLRSWLQSNIHRGDTLCWSSGELVSVPFCKFEELGLAVSISAVQEDRKKLLDYMKNKNIDPSIIEQVDSLYIELDRIST